MLTKWQNQNLEIFDKVVHNFGKSDDDLSEKMLISTKVSSF